MEWNGGMENFKVYFQILHPNKAHIPINQHINTGMCLMKSVPTHLTMGMSLRLTLI